MQLGSINNVNSGSANGPTYTDYTGQFTTTLERDSSYTITVTAGDYSPDNYVVWIDYDQTGIFETTERLGEWPNLIAGEVHSLTFTVPTNALPGNTRMRVRGVYHATGEPVPTDACYSYQYGETEDYGIVIETSTGLGSSGPNDILLFPDPADRSILLSSSITTAIRAVVLDPSGRTLLAQTIGSSRPSVDVSALANGRYLLRMEVNGILRTLPFTVQHGR